MNITRASALVSKELRRVIREPSNLFMVFVFPLVLTLAFGASFGALGGGENRYAVAYVNTDQGQFGSLFGSAMAHIPAVEIINYTDAQVALNDLQQGRLKGVIDVPRDFTESLQSFRAYPSTPGRWLNTTLTLYVDEGSMVASAAIPPLVQQVLSAMVTGTQATGRLPVTIGSPTPVQAAKLSQFAYMAPGLFGYAAIFLIMIVAGALVGEREQGILRRISVTPTTVGDIFASQVASNLIVGVAQVCVVYAASYAMGFRPLGGLSGILVASAIVLSLCVCSVGFGLLTASFAKNNGAATGISFMFILPQMFLGTFVPAPEYISRLVPSWYVTDALTSIFLRGASPLSQSILLDLATIIVSSTVILIVGMLAFRRFGRS